MCCHSSVQHSAADSIAVVAVADNIVVDIAVEPAPAAVNSHMPAEPTVVAPVPAVSVAAHNTVPARSVSHTAVPHTVVQAVPAVRHWRLPMHRCMQSKHLHCHHNTNCNLDIFS